MKKIILIALTLLANMHIFGQSQEEFSAMLTELNGDSMQATIAALQQYQRCVYFGNRDAAQYLVDKMQQIGLQNVKIDSFYLWENNVHYYNVRGSIFGSAAPDSIVLVGAHYDKLTLGTDGDTLLTLSGGVDNNAAGVALILEVARVLKAHQFAPRTTVEFIALDAYEMEMLGSFMDAAERTPHQEIVKLMLNNDRVAYDPQNLHMMTILWYENSMQERSDATLMMENFSQLLPIMMDVAGNLPESQAGDAYPYASYGYPAVFFRESTLSPYHHTLEDQLENCNLDNVVELAKVNLAMIIHYAFHDVFSLSDGIASHQKTNLEVSPNPTTGAIRIKLAEDSDHEILVKVFDIQGQLLSCQTIVSSSPIISMEALPAGLYLLKAYDGDKMIGISKIVRQ